MKTEDLNQFMNEIKVKTEALVAEKRALADKLKPDFAKIFVPFLTKYPQIKSVSWRQYTPYFNDGEPCKFGVGDLYGFTGNDDECKYEGSLSTYGIYDDELKALPTLKEDFKKVYNLLSSIPDDIMLELFGDHAKVVVTVDGLEVEEYDHD